MHLVSSATSYLFSHSNYTSKSKPSRCCSSELTKKIGAIFCSFLLITSGMAAAQVRPRKMTELGPFYPHEVQCGIQEEPNNNSIASAYVDTTHHLAQPSIAPGSTFPQGWDAFWLNEALLGKKGDCGCFRARLGSLLPTSFDKVFLKNTIETQRHRGTETLRDLSMLMSVDPGIILRNNVHGASAAKRGKKSAALP